MRESPQISVRYFGEVVVFDIRGYLTQDSEKDMESAYQHEGVQESEKILLKFDA